MWRCVCATELPDASAGARSCQASTGKYTAADLTEQLAQSEQLVVQLKEQLQDKENQLLVKDQQLKEWWQKIVQIVEESFLLLHNSKDEIVQEKMQVLEDLEADIRGKEEALLERTQLVEVLQEKLDWKNRELAVLVEDLRDVEAENENLNDKLWAEKETNSFHYFTERKVEELEEQVRLMAQEAEEAEARFMTMAASYKSKINQIQKELDNVQLAHAQKLLLELQDTEVDYEEENDQLLLNVDWPKYVEAQNEKLQAIVDQFEEQYQDMHIDLEQVTKGATSQGQETPCYDERTAMELRLKQVEEKREDLISELQELAVGLGYLHRRQDQGLTNQTTAGQKLKVKRRVNFFKRIFTARRR